ncbi:MAG TPA: glutamine-hydrolyzing carbamoyl-phosphate synthase small subunit [Nocardioidaceae bacterium]|nr:glutamine-hydrolyzing carbamoyl-phosphate synthase small subunit [Nocardioidaceae bacterium]
MTAGGGAAGSYGRRGATPAVLVLEDGRTFHGESFGATGEAIGEAVFSTGMTGYQETLTDPSYHRQVVVMTTPHVGNTGINSEDTESTRIWVAGYVVRDPARVASSWRSSGALGDQLAEQGVVGISGVDTRALTRHLRERGAMRVAISTVEPDVARLLERVRSAPEMSGAALADEVSTPEAYVVPAVGQRRFRVAALDLGIKTMTPTLLASAGVEVVVMPAATTLDELTAVDPDGVFFSNGPGDPATAEPQIDVLRGVLDAGLPYFGICFGNQLFGRALGLSTYKLRYGHRGINQPVCDLTTGKVEVTAHNHGFAVAWPGRDTGTPAHVSSGDERPEGHDPLPITDTRIETPYGLAEVTHVSLNDDVVEGLRLVDRPAFSVQYHPEAAAGPHDAGYLFGRFVDLLAETTARGHAGGGGRL